MFFKLFRIPARFETDTLLVRGLTLDDAPALFEAIYSDPETMRFSLSEVHRTVQDTVKFLEIMLRDNEMGLRTCLVILDKASGSIIGTIELLTQHFPLIEIGTFTSRHGPRRRVSLVHAHRLIVEWLLAQRSVTGVIAFCAVNNVTHRLLERLGFICEKIVPNHQAQPNQGLGPVDHYLYQRGKASGVGYGQGALIFNGVPSLARAATPAY